MAETVLDGGIELGERVIAAIRDEKRVITETSAASGLEAQPALTAALKDMLLAAAPGNDQHAHKVRRTAFLRHIAHHGHQLCQILGAAGPRTGIVGRLHARRSSKRVHTQSAVVRQRPRPRRQPFP
jgi:hypothetical protein